MINVTFVCLGNICRSPMAELVFKDMINRHELSDKFSVNSCGTSSCEAGSSIYPPVQRVLARRGISGSHIARKMTDRELDDSDYILVMDESNLFDIERKTGGKYKDKTFKLCSFTQNPRDVADPWYTRDFETAYNDIFDGCRCFLDYILREKM